MIVWLLSGLWYSVHKQYFQIGCRVLFWNLESSECRYWYFVAYIMPFIRVILVKWLRLWFYCIRSEWKFDSKADYVSTSKTWTGQFFKFVFHFAQFSVLRIILTTEGETFLKLWVKKTYVCKPLLVTRAVFWHAMRRVVIETLVTDEVMI